MSQEIIVNPAISIPVVSDELIEQFKFWNDAHHKYSDIHNKMAFQENKLIGKKRESITSPDAQTFSKEEDLLMRELSLTREVNQCYLGLSTMMLQELRNKYITGHGEFKIENKPLSIDQMKVIMD